MGLCPLSCKTTHLCTCPHIHTGHDSKPSSLKRRLSPPMQKPYPVVSQVNISGEMPINGKTFLKSIKKNIQKPLTSEEFPSYKEHRGPRYEMRFFPSNFGKGSVSLYIDVAQAYLRKKSKSTEHSVVEIPKMSITVTLFLCNEGAGGSKEIKSVSITTEKKEIDSRSKAAETAVIASFPKLVSHTELNLSETEGQGIVICVNMKSN